MKTNKKFYKLKLLICLLLYANSAIGQGNKSVVENIYTEENFRYPGTIKIAVKTKSGTEIRDVRRNDSFDADATIEVLKQEGNKKYTLHLNTINGTKVIMPTETVVKMKITKEKESYDLLQIPSNKELRINKLKAYLGNVLTYGLKDRIEALTVGTEFSLIQTNDDLGFKLFHGKLNINHLVKREIKDDKVLDNDGKRSLFIRENSRLTVKDSVYPNPEINYDSLPVLTDDKEIKKFLRKPVLDQKRDLLNRGEYSKKAVKDIEIDASIDEALISFEKAMENDELTIEFIVQSALLFADSYLFNDDIEKSKIWLEVGIHFRNELFEKKQKLIDEELDNENYAATNIEKALRNELMYEMLTVNEFSAWAFDIKLKLHGCLENSKENPSKYRLNAANLLNAIENNNKELRN